MRRNRVKVEGAYYHVMSRCALQAYLLKEDGEEVKGMFMKMLRKAEYFSGVKIVNYCVMDNHFHLLLQVPKRREVSDEELEKRIRVLYGEKRSAQILGRWEQLLKMGGFDDVVRRERDAMRRRMYDISQFMKTFKQRFTLWYSANHGNLEGTIWQGVFHSVLVEGKHDALGAVSTYITLNPVRAQMVADPADYAWSGYGAACAGDARARKALLSAYDGDATMDAKWQAYKAMLDVRLAEIGGAEPKPVMPDGATACGAAGAEAADGEGGAGKGKDAVTASVSVTLRKRDKGIARGLAFGSNGFVWAAIRKFCARERTITCPRPIGVGQRRTQLFCAGRRRA